MSQEVFNFIGDPTRCWVCHRKEGEEVPLVEKRGDTVVSETTQKINVTRIAEETEEEVYSVCQCCRTLIRGLHTLIHATAPLG